MSDRTDYTAATVSRFCKIAASHNLTASDIDSFCSRISVYADTDPSSKGLPRLVIHLIDENLGYFGADIFIEFRGSGYAARCERVENWSRPDSAMRVSHPIVSAQPTANDALQRLLELYANRISQGLRRARI